MSRALHTEKTRAPKPVEKARVPESENGLAQAYVPMPLAVLRAVPKRWTLSRDTASPSAIRSTPAMRLAIWGVTPSESSIATRCITMAPCE